MKDKPVGVFDSGIGGLTVVKEILEVLPKESLIYLGDTARVPYGTRSKEVITNFALEMVRFLLSKKVKCLVVACNTISASCLKEIEAISPVPVLNVVTPTVKEAVKISKTKVGIIGTKATINAGSYEREIKNIRPEMEVFVQSCPLFVPLAEEGLLTHPATILIAEEYLKELSKSEIDTLILGCTHYPLLSEVIQVVIGEKVKLLSSGKATALELKKILEEQNLTNGKTLVKHEFYVTDDPQKVAVVAERFMGKILPGKLEKVSLED